MVYRKTAKVVAGLTARRALIVASAVDVISSHGTLTATAVTDRAGVSKGLLFNYFPDMTELRVAVVADLLSSDMAAIAAAKVPDPLQCLAACLSAYYGALGPPPLSQFRLSSPIHFGAMRGAFGGLIRAAVPDTAPKASGVAAGAALGVLYGLHAMGARSKNDAWAASVFALRAIGARQPEPA